ncbi:MAG: AAA family ATPase [Leptospirales bacterium]|nr:AAA family ATPase [Leptospirales bacterium]
MSDIDALRRAAQQSPDNVPLLLLLAEACINASNANEARETFERALAIDGNLPEAMLGIARAILLLEKRSEAIVRSEVIVERFPGFAPARLFLAQLLHAEGREAEARKKYEEALVLDSGLRDPDLEEEIVNKKSEPTKLTADSRPAQETSAAADGTFEEPTLTFQGVGGMDSVKEEIRMKILYPMKNPELFRAYGKKPGGGVLLYGPPGCGKTMLSRATAGEIHARFLSIGIHEILDLYLGNSEKNLHQIFEQARANTPAVLFFDEVDALAADRNDMKRSAGRTLINQFLAELDGTNGSNEGLLVLGATNAPWHIDPAFRRPGRFDRILFVPPPDETARKSIIALMAEGKPTNSLDIASIAKKTKDFSGADLKLVFDVTIERCLARALKENKMQPITTDELLKSVKAIQPSTKAWFESARNYAMYSNQSGFYNDILTFLGINKPSN